MNQIVKTEERVAKELNTTAVYINGRCMVKGYGRFDGDSVMAYERESLIEKHLVAEVKKAGGVAFKFVSPGRRSVPDRIVLLPGGRLVFVECKAPGKPPRADQLREHERLRALGFTVVVLDSKNLEGILCEKSNDAVNSA
jgi:hypothetical protein